MTTATSTLVITAYSCMIALEILALLVTGDLILFIVVRLMQYALQLGVRSLRESVAPQTRSYEALDRLLSKLIYGDAAIFGLFSLIFLHRRLWLWCFVSALPTLVALPQIWRVHVKEITTEE